MSNCRKPRHDTPESRLLNQYMRIARKHRCVLEKRLNSTGVYRSQHRVLMCIHDHPNISQKELARMNDVTSATIAVTLKKLEKGGYISRTVDERDNRFNQITVTEKGQQVVGDSRRIFSEVEKAMFSGFTEEEFAVMSGYFDRIMENLARLELGEGIGGRLEETKGCCTEAAEQVNVPGTENSGRAVRSISTRNRAARNTESEDISN